jgi:hypothetical protein
MYERARSWQPHRPLRAVRSDMTDVTDVTAMTAAPITSLMELTARLGGEPGTDHPECVHPTLAAVARGVYEHCSDAAKPGLLPLAPSLLDTACTGLDLPARLVATCVSTALASPLPDRIDADRARRLEGAAHTASYLMSRAVGGSGLDDDHQPRAATRMWVLVLSPFRLTEPTYRRLVSPDAVAEAVVVTAAASGDARDERLSRLLRWCIDLTRRRLDDSSEGCVESRK